MSPNTNVIVLAWIFLFVAGRGMSFNSAVRDYLSVLAMKEISFVGAINATIQRLMAAVEGRRLIAKPGKDAVKEKLTF